MLQRQRKGSGRGPTSPAASIVGARIWVSRIGKTRSFDALNTTLAGLRIDDYAGEDRRAIEAAIDHQRDYMIRIARTL